MKKCILISLSFMLLTSAAFSQLSAGIKFGGNASQFHQGKAEPDNKLKASPTAGLFSNIRMSKGVSLRIEALYSNKGCLINTDLPNPQDGMRYRLNMRYAEFPVVFRLGAGQFKFEAGGFAAYLFDMDIKGFNFESDIVSHNENDYRRLDYGAVAGVAYRWDWATFNLRYSHGLNSVGHPGQPLNWPDAGKQFYSQNIALFMELPTKR